MAVREIFSIEVLEMDQMSIRLICKNVKRMTLRIRKPYLAEVVYPRYILPEEAVNFARSNYDWMIKKSVQLGIAEEEAGIFRPFSPEEREAFTQLLKERLPLWENKMGLRARSITVKLMKTRWGSCNKRTASLSINLALCRKPLEALDYIIVHELSHLAEPNHSPRFWAIVERYCPEWRRIRRELRSEKTY